MNDQEIITITVRRTYEIRVPKRVNEIETSGELLDAITREADVGSLDGTIRLVQLEWADSTGPIWTAETIFDLDNVLDQVDYAVKEVDVVID